MVTFPFCKINLGLHVLEKRSDGFHNIETCFYPVPWTDILEMVPANDFSFTNSGITVPGNWESNLCVKAYQLLKQDFNLPPVHIYLHKIVPMGAGLGGGSSDGAHSIRLLSEIFNLSLSQQQLETYASVLGSDCSFFLKHEAMLGTQKGEVLSPVAISLAGKYITIVKPPVHVSTAEAYAGVKPGTPAQKVKSIIENYSLSEWKNVLLNDFEESVFRKYPQIQEIKKRLYDLGAAYAAMSGSGSSVFGIFNNPQAIGEFPGCIVWTGLLR
jgi:4-diphosphocytidyl-2-C-methyl-D-erythritol kinase